MNVVGLACATLLDKTFDSDLLVSSTIRKTGENRGHLTIQRLTVLSSVSTFLGYPPSHTLPIASRRAERLFHYRFRGVILRRRHEDLIHSHHVLLRVDSCIEASVKF